MNFGALALMVSTRSWPAQRSGAPRPGPCADRGGLWLGLAEELLDGDQVPGGLRQMSIDVHAATDSSPISEPSYETRGLAVCQGARACSRSEESQDVIPGRFLNRPREAECGREPAL